MARGLPRGLQVCNERRADLLLSVYLVCALICLNLLNRPKEDGTRLLA